LKNSIPGPARFTFLSFEDGKSYNDAVVPTFNVKQRLQGTQFFAYLQTKGSVTLASPGQSSKICRKTSWGSEFIVRFISDYSEAGMAVGHKYTRGLTETIYSIRQQNKQRIIHI
jgi:hypothetical protein